jgi:hypothetical protein
MRQIKESMIHMPILNSRRTALHAARPSWFPKQPFRRVDLDLMILNPEMS